jgi:hypothetical protein
MEISINKKASNYFFIYSSAAPTGKKTKLYYERTPHHRVSKKHIDVNIIDDILEGTFVDFVNANDSIKNYAEKREKYVKEVEKFLENFKDKFNIKEENEFLLYELDIFDENEWYEWLKLNHPDKGGSVTTFLKVFAEGTKCGYTTNLFKI